MISKNAFLRKRYLSLLLVVGVLTWFSNSMEFSMNDKEIISYLGEENIIEIGYLDVAKRKVRYIRKDNKAPTTVVFVHGAPGSATAFIDFFKNKDLGARVNLISIDRPGYGYSGLGDPEPSLTIQAGVIKELVTNLNLDQVILVGHSLGAPIIAKAAFERQELYAGLIMVAGSIDPELEPKEWYRPWLRNWVMKKMLPASLYVTNEEIYQLKSQLDEMQPHWLNLSIPLIVIQGEDDILVPKENVSFAEYRVDDKYLEVQMVKGVNHFIPWNRPDLIIDSILKLEEKL